MNNNESTTNSHYKPASYKWWKDKKMIGTIMLVSTVILIIFSFVKVPVISSINGYTVGMLLGFYSPLFYLYVIYKSCVMIFEDRIKLPTWIKMTNRSYWFVVISIVFISTSLGYYQSKEGFTDIGTKTWHSFNVWFDAFTENGKGSAWTPANTNGGVIGAFLYSFTAMMLSGIGSLILAIISLITSASILITGTGFGIYKYKRKKKETQLVSDEERKHEPVEAQPEAKQKEVKQTSEEFPFIDEFDDDKPVVKPENNINDLPFDDPF